MTRDDVDPAVTAILADHWGDRRAWFEFTVDSAACHPLVADIDGQVVGTGVATVNGPVAWIGTIWVARDHRRHGIGAALTDAVMDIAAAEGAKTLLLVATDRGRPLYERSGFEVQTWYRTFVAPGMAAPADEGPLGEAPDTRLRPFRPDDLAPMTTLDHAATGEDRRQVLRELATPTGTRVLDAGDGDIRGFVVRAPWGGGATVAPRLEDAIAIVEARRRAGAPEKRTRCGILLENEAGADALERAGWTEAWRAPRLIRGAPLTWQPDQLWGQFNHAMG